MVVAADVKGLRTRNNGSKFQNSNSALKKPKMKMKAAKVLKFLLNFIQIKPKNKLGRKENRCVTSCNHNISNITNDNIPLIPNTTESFSCQQNNGMSWSCYVNEPFVSNLDGCVRTEDLESGGIFCNESYFEDDYCQDFCEFNMPVNSDLDGMQSLMSDNYRLFEPQRTPCGEFKRSSAVTVSARRRHSSLPDIGVKDEPLTVIPAQSLDIDLDNTSELFDYNQFVCSHPPLGLNIAFDNFLDETIINHKSFSMNHVQFLPIKEINTDQLGKLKLETESNILQRCPENVEATCFVDNSKQLDIITSEMLAFQSANVIKAFSEDQVSDISVACLITKESQDKDVALVESEFCSLNMSSTSSLQNKMLGTTETIKSVSEGIYTLKQTSGQRSLESGYSTSDVSHASFESVTTPDLSQSVGYGISKITQIKILDTKSHDANVEEIARIHHSTITLPKRSFIEPIKINRTNTVPATSSPMHISNISSLSSQTFTAIPDFISPINKISATSEIRLETLDHDSFRRKIRHKKRDILADICLCPTLSHLEVNDNQVLKPLSEDYNILTTAADFIVKRIKFKEELTPYINIEKLIEYLDTYYVAEISKLSNKNIQTIADYRRITKEALDTFTSDRLTQENCFQELLIAILGNRSRTVSVCQDYIFENLHYIVSSGEYLKAAPELIIMLMCSGHSSILKQRLGNKAFQFKVKGAMRNFLKTQTDLKIYSPVKRMFSCAFKEMTRNLNYTVADKMFTAVPIAETKVQTEVKLASPEYTESFCRSLFRYS